MCVAFENKNNTRVATEYQSVRIIVKLSLVVCMCCIPCTCTCACACAVCRARLRVRVRVRVRVRCAMCDVRCVHVCSVRVLYARVMYAMCVCVRVRVIRPSFPSSPLSVRLLATPLQHQVVLHTAQHQGSGSVP